MKRILSLFLTVCLLLTLMPAAKAAEITQSGVCGENLTWMLDSDGVLTIRGDGPMTDYELSYETGEYTSNSPFWENRSGIKTAVVESGVTSIGAQAFREIETPFFHY